MPSVLTFLHQLTRRWTAADAAVDVHAPLLTDAELNALMTPVPAPHETPRYRRDTLAHDGGDARSSRLGHGLDFEESRLYQRGDDVRAMDWRTTARSGKPYLKIYREEHQPVLHVVIDRNTSMRFGTRTQLKVAQAARLAVLCAYTAVRANTCIGGTLWQPDEITVSCRNGEAGALSLVRAAIAACPPLDEASRSKPSWTALCRSLNASLPIGARIILLSDFARVAETDGPVLRALAARHDVSAIQILDAAENELPDVGVMRFVDRARDLTGWLDTRSATIREAFRVNAAARHEQQRRIFDRAGIALVRCMTQDDATEVWQSLQG